VPTGYVEFAEGGTTYDVDVTDGQATFLTDLSVQPSLANEIDATFLPYYDGPGDFLASSQVSAFYDVGSVTLGAQAGDTVPTDPISAVPNGGTVSVVGSSNNEFSAVLDAVDAGNGTPPGPLNIAIATSTTDITSTVVTQAASEGAPSLDPETGQSDYYWTVPANALYTIAPTGSATVTISSAGSGDFVPISLSFTLNWS
jgi:hypothetical protein